MKHRTALFLWLWIIALSVACGGNNAATTAPAEPPAAPAAPAETTELTEEEATAYAAALELTSQTETEGDPAASEECEEYFRFCVASTVSGAVEAVAAAGVGGNIESCAVWAAPGEARILELPLMLAAGEEVITAALTRIAAYTGPGRYELRAVSTTGIPDMFPTIEAAGRTFNNGDGSTAVVTINADGSGALEARNLIEIASLQVSNPDPSARVNFDMQWTCQDS